MAKKRNFCKKFGKRLKLWQKIEIAKNLNFGKKLKFWQKIEISAKIELVVEHEPYPSGFPKH